MIEFIKELFKRDRSVELRLLDIIESQQKFISENINERVVYANEDVGYTNADRFESTVEYNDEDDINQVLEDDLTPDDLREQMEAKYKK